MNFDDAPDTLKLAEGAALARVGLRQFRAAVQRGDIPSARLGRSIRVSKHALQRWLEGDGQTPEPRLAVVGGGRVTGPRPPRA